MNRLRRSNNDVRSLSMHLTVKSNLSSVLTFPTIPLRLLPPSTLAGGLLLTFGFSVKSAILVIALTYYVALIGNVLAARFPRSTKSSLATEWILSFVIGISLVLVSQQLTLALTSFSHGWLIPALSLFFGKRDATARVTKMAELSSDQLFPILVCAVGLISDVYPIMNFAYAALLILYFIRERSNIFLLTFLAFLMFVSIKLMTSTSQWSSFLMSDDSIYLDAYGYSINRHGFWSWSTSSDTWNAYHWFTYGITGFFSDFANLPSLTGPTIFATVLGGVLLAFALHATAQTLSNSTKAISLFVIVFPIFGRLLWGSVSPSLDFGLIVALTIVLLLTRFWEQASDSPGLLMFFCVVLLTYVLGTTKAQIFLCLVPAIVIEMLLPNSRFTFMQRVRWIIAPSIGTILTLLFTFDIFKIASNRDFGISKPELSPWVLHVLNSEIDQIHFGTFLNKALAVTFCFSPIILAKIFGIGRGNRLIRVSMLSAIFSFLLYVFLGIEHTEYALSFSFWLSVILLGPLVVQEALLKYPFQYTKTRLSGFVFLGVVISLGSYLFGIRWISLDFWLRFDTDDIYFVTPVYFASLFFVLFIRFVNLRSIRLVGRNSLIIFFVCTLLGSLISKDANLLIGDVALRSSNAQRLDTITQSVNDIELIKATTWLKKHSHYSDIIASNVQCDYGTSCPLDGVTPIAALTQRRTFFEAPRFAIGALDSPLTDNDPSTNFPDWVLARWKLSADLQPMVSFSTYQQLKQLGIKWLLISIPDFQQGAPSTFSSIVFTNSSYVVVKLND